LPRWVLYAGGLALLFLIAGGGAVAVVLSSRGKVRAALRRASSTAGLDPDWLDAIGKVESGWDANPATNMEGSDGARGGAWGATQITERTARDAGYEGEMKDLLGEENLDAMAALSATILAAGHPRNFAEAVAVWNAGRYGADVNFDNDLEPGEAPEKTVEDYWPKVQAALLAVQASPVA
jgi:soluble lytic murein transglycosylase-like protein